MRRQVESPVWLLIVGLIYCGPIHSVVASFENKTNHVSGSGSSSSSNNRPRVFSPRMDYDEWTPLGRGNPLRNDPTYDYVPPVLDRVQYWLDSHTTESSSKRDILLLGATAKKTSAKLPEQYVNFANRPKFGNNPEVPTGYKKNYTNKPGPDPVKIRTTNFRNDVIDYRNQNRMPSVSGSYYSNSYYGQQSKPYTMMLPPPLVPNPIGDHLTYDHSSKDQSFQDSYQFSTQTESGPLLQSDRHPYDYPSKAYSHYPRLSHSQGTLKPTPKGTLVSHSIETVKSYSPSSEGQNQKPEATTSSVSFEKSDLVYQSSQTLSGGWLVNDKRPGATKTDTNNRKGSYYQEIDHQTAGSSTHEVVIGQNANIIVQGESCGNDEVVIGHKEAAPSVPVSNGVGSTIAGNTEKEDENIGEFASTSNMHIVLANAPPPETTDSAVALVMSTKYVENNETPVVQQDEKSPSVSTESKKLGFVEMEKIQHKEKNSSFNATGSSSTPVEYLEDPWAVSSMINPVPYHRPTTRHPPSRISDGFPTQQMGQRQAVQGRPVQGTIHYGDNHHADIGMGLRPPAPPVIGNVPNHMADMHRRPPPNIMMTNMEDHNEIRRPMQSLVTTMTSVRPIVTSGSGNADQGLGQMMDKRGPFQTTFSPTPPTYTGGFLPADEDTTSIKRKVQSQLAILLQNEDTKRNISTFTMKSTTSSPIPTTTVSSLTTDQIFSHYKQPEKPIRGPMYLIIQGHSKVKTYKPSVDNHANGFEENEILDNTSVRPISKYEQIVNENTKSIAKKVTATKNKDEDKRKPQGISASAGQDSLLSLLESGLSAFAMPPLTDLEDEKTNSTTAVSSL